MNRTMAARWGTFVVTAGLLGSLGVVTPTLAQERLSAKRTVSPHRANLVLMQRQVDVDLEETRLEDIMTFLTEFTGAELEVLWATDRAEGLDKEMLITVSGSKMSALAFLEKVLFKTQDGFIEASWQMTRYGTIQVGTKDRLNRFKRTEIYDINDMLFVIPDYADAPEIDLESVLQQGEGGQGQSPFDDNNDDDDEDRLTRQERAQEIVDLIVDLVEPDQWLDNGGSGGSIRYFQGSLIVNAPDYLHRQVNGYPFWPARRTATSPSGKRYVTLDMDNSIGTVDGFDQRPVTGTAGGGTGQPGGGG